MEMWNEKTQTLNLKSQNLKRRCYVTTEKSKI